MNVAGATVSATLAKRPAHVLHVGYGVLNAVADFSPIETPTKCDRGNGCRKRG